jgi:peptidyl-prolyl cis-trans isomerase C
MKNHIALCALLAGAALLTACAKKDGEKAAEAPKDVVAVATIDGKPISKELFEFYASNVTRKPVAELSDEQKNAVLDDLIDRKIVAEAAEKAGLEKDPEVAGALELTRLNVLMQAAVKKELSVKPTDQEMRAEYETWAASQPKYEYKARHILVATEPFAQTLIDRINKGANFADIAKKESMDGSKAQGGDLGWFAPTMMVKPFADAVMALEKGKMTQTPVQTQFGWHIIRLDDTRDLEVRDFEQVKQEMERSVQQKKAQSYLDGLKKTRTIEKKLDAAAKPATDANPAPTPTGPG